VIRKTERKAISYELLAHFAAEGEAFLSWIVTVDEPWVHHVERETKGTNLSLPRRKIKNSPSASKVMITVFWDCEGVILVDAMSRGEMTQTHTSGC
jgi:hypothetical protein